MVRTDKPLFSQERLDEVLWALEQQMYGEIDGIDGNSLLNASVEDLCDYFEERYEVAVPRLKEEEISIDQREAKIDVSRDPQRVIYDRSRPFYITGTGIAFYVPFEGDPSLFDCRPSTYTTIFPYATVSGNELLLSYESTDQNPQAARSFLGHNLSQIRRHLGWMSADASPYNNSVRSKARTRIEARRDKLLKDRGMAEALGIPLRRRDDAPETYTVPTVRERVPISHPPGNTTPYAPEPALDMEVYDHILSVISNMAEVIERSPHAFRQMGEEDLRQHFLVQLNGQYEGQATGETFNFQGKTDILVRWDGKNVFIAECKFWGGPESLKKALDQLLGYAAWRDTKTALLVFNRQKNFGSVLEKIPEVVKGHPNFKRELPYDKLETGFRFVLHHPGEPSRELILTVIAFDVPT